MAKFKESGIEHGEASKQEGFIGYKQFKKVFVGSPRREAPVMEVDACESEGEEAFNFIGGSSMGHSLSFRQNTRAKRPCVHTSFSKERQAGNETTGSSVTILL